MHNTEAFVHGVNLEPFSAAAIEKEQALAQSEAG
jgi:hypothetical protein